MNTHANPPVAVEVLPVTPFQQNCSLIVCQRTKKAALVDPGGEVERLLTLEKVLVSHGHLDHCSGVAELQQRLGVPVEGPHPDDDFWIQQLPTRAAEYGFPPAQVFTPDRWLAHGERVSVGALELEVLHCPGHTPGHVVFFLREVGLAFVGDVIFAGSIGRTDFPRGNHADLIRSIRERLFALGDSVQFVPGHGPVSTLGRERMGNPYVSDAAVAAR
jgi:glyoxylase-like metal-dependent hydrolase (beta-lactamase superfamily II)